jgi:hypothetical protein
VRAGKVPPGVHVWADEAGDVQWDGPNSLTWFLEVLHFQTCIFSLYP